MDFSPPPGIDQLRESVREFISEHVTREVVHRAFTSGTMHDWDVHRALARRGWVAPTWPSAEGGAGLSELESMILLDELHRAGVPLDGWITTMTGASAIRALGTTAQKDEVVKRVVAGDALVALGFSEPDSGSDVAAARTRAVRDGDDWIINGQKMFTTMAHLASWVLLLARTDSEAAKHRGLTLFLVPMDSDGIVVEPVHTLGGERTNITFYTDVRVPDSARVHHLNKGWEALTFALTAERGSAFGAGSSFLGTMRQMLDASIAWVNETGPDGHRPVDDRSTRRAIAKAMVDREVSRLLTLRSIWMTGSGGQSDVEASIAKLFTSEALLRMSSELLEILGPEGLLSHKAEGAPAGGTIEHGYRHSPVTTIYGGSSEVMRNIISQRGLGLPRS